MSDSPATTPKRAAESSGQNESSKKKKKVPKKIAPITKTNIFNNLKAFHQEYVWKKFYLFIYF